ncbi:hypothetical protein PTTG_29540 [Puccinia triticina 1-1 BBBD Race 1]|uniref:POP4 domain-containing protein n=2 Tax=Puccinia triticina TaxID=208348 RepID=A0A180G3I0_PUCT1|nr:uncharacterized protein PtA15_14A126 [Puccinia triticina]OAV87160.1 hypothetical protein PTTG_29540 [Puccinia triticina 1-1 BBBD Race 1]WAQ91244.1 hypothetical protein PtA15_14A126 [Puccinia triticina]WAR62046.1 hypothetical protein PtB15_14B140 [Puccinia triticina]
MNMNQTATDNASSSKETVQDLYAEPKFVKKKRKKEVSEGIDNPIWDPKTGSLSVKQIISTIVPEPIPNLERNYQSKVNSRHLALHPTDQSRSRNTQIGSFKPKRKCPTERQVRFLELERLIEVEQKRYRYQDFVPLHQLWLGYMSELLELRLKNLDEQTTILTIPTEGPLFRSEKFAGMPSMAAIQSKLLKADYHGAHLLVHKAKNPSLVNLQGIVIQESEQTFKLIQDDNRIKTIPKAHTIFQMSLPLLRSPSATTTHTDEKNSNEESSFLVFKIFGNQFTFRPTERINKKFKSKAFSQL